MGVSWQTQTGSSARREEVDETNAGGIPERLEDGGRRLEVRVRQPVLVERTAAVGRDEEREGIDVHRCVR